MPGNFSLLSSSFFSMGNLRVSQTNRESVLSVLRISSSGIAKIGAKSLATFSGALIIPGSAYTAGVGMLIANSLPFRSRILPLSAVTCSIFNL